MRLFSEDMIHAFFLFEIALGNSAFYKRMQICNNSAVNQSINYFFEIASN